jgi:hypothetical protein
MVAFDSNDKEESKKIHEKKIENSNNNLRHHNEKHTKFI